MTKLIINKKYLLSVFAFLITVSSCPLILANSGEEMNFPQSLSTHPANRYSGSAPIDLGNGLNFNNGTYGLPNSDYTHWAAKKPIVPYVSENSYPFEAKCEFVSGLEKNIEFVQAAIDGWSNTTAITKPEVIEYSKNAIAKIEPALNLAIETTKKASSAGPSEWSQAQESARRAVVDLRNTYTSLHNNVR